MGLLDEVRENISQECLSNRCRKDDCSISLRNAPNPRIIIDFDKPNPLLGEHDSRCDYLFIAEEENDESVWVAPLELKSGRVDASQVIRQLRAGARAAEDVVPQNELVRFRPVTAHGGGIHTAERIKLRHTANRIRFRGQREYVRLMSCSSPLIQALRQSR